ncbi:unnamed protein product [Angiostrongylus costaricensis]|uniref:HORMA domain-containing protein n=1 Tax=Angiostrongylus costaricensis TaxID=334426 RepID=A0A158PLN8_ANGCS|nr:unnamed protein product [Angiostrongylus costaricensis]
MKAIEQRYLRELMLVITPTNEDLLDAIEMYTWRMRYDVDGEPQAELRQGLQYLKRQTIELLLLLRVLCRDTLTPLPAGPSSMIRITYTDRTPKGYQAPGFYRSPEDPVLRPEPRHLERATLQTKYHGKATDHVDENAMKMRLKKVLQLPYPDDSLNDAFDEMGAGDEAHRSVNNDTIECISETALQQCESVEIAREEVGIADETSSRSSPRIPDSVSSNSPRLSVAAERGSVADLNISGSTPPAEEYPRRSRRGRLAVTTKQAQLVHECSESLVSSLSQVVNVSTPPSTNPFTVSEEKSLM